MDESELIEKVNLVRYKPGKTGHYESFFLRANHPYQPLAFWIRYTIFQPNKRPDKAIGELWAVVFNDTNDMHSALKAEYPIDKCSLGEDDFTVIIGKALLNANMLYGCIEFGGQSIEWNLTYTGNQEPLFLFPHKLYSAPLPKAKVLVSLPFAQFNGTIKVNGEVIEIKNWIGSQNHNWGSKHTDHYAWGQVAGFDNEPDAFLELATARIKIGPLWTPFMTPIVFRYKNQEYSLNTLTKTFGRAQFEYFYWDFHGKENAMAIEGSIFALKKDFVCLPYYNPPGGIKYCLNTKIASCNIRVLVNDTELCLKTKNRAAFEILTDDNSHGLKTIVWI